MVDFLFGLIELFRYLLRFRSYEANVYSLAVFAGVDLFALKFYLFTWRESSPSHHSWHQKTRDTGLSDGEDRILLRSLAHFDTIPECDRQTD